MRQAKTEGLQLSFSEGTCFLLIRDNLGQFQVCIEGNQRG